jgi:hypothetical protein
MLPTFLLIAAIVGTISISIAWASPIFILPGIGLFVLLDRYFFNNSDVGETFQAILGLLGLAGIVAQFFF